MSEGVHSGLPMILMPLFGDQYQNSVAAEARGVAVVLEFSELNEKNLRHAVDEVFNNTKYVTVFIHRYGIPFKVIPGPRSDRKSVV